VGELYQSTSANKKGAKNKEVEKKVPAMMMRSRLTEPDEMRTE